jgi:hypothetical protein
MTRYAVISNWREERPMESSRRDFEKIPCPHQGQNSIMVRSASSPSCRMSASVRASPKSTILAPATITPQWTSRPTSAPG